MNSTASNLELKKRTIDYIEQSGWFDDVCEEIANGGSLLEICRSYGIRYALVYRTIMLDPQKKSVYDSAIESRKELLMQDILDQMRDIAKNDSISSVRLKALETIGKHLGMFVERHEVSGRVTLEDLVSQSMFIPESRL